MPTIATTADFRSALRRFSLLTPGQIEALDGDAALRPSDPQALAKELMQRGWLTPYQVNQIFLDQAQELVLASYVLLDRIGQGAMGQIFRARHQTMNRIVAIKVLRKERLANPDSVQRFKREIRAAGQLAHPRFVVVFDADEFNGTHFYAMEFIAGTDLSQLVKQYGPLPITRVCEYIYQAAEGLQYAHERGLIHRDLKPANLLLEANADPPSIKILDMGLARLTALTDDEATLTHDGKVVGTPDYISPEQARCSRTVDIRADLYSLGCTMYYLLTAKVPFPGGSSLMEKLMKHQLEDPVPIETLRPEIPEEIRAILRRLIAREPDNRFATPAALMAALRPFRMPPPGSRPSARIIRSKPTAEERSAPVAEPPTPTPEEGTPIAERDTIVEQWFYLHKNQVFGPIPATQIKERAARGDLLPEDLLWPMGVEPEYAVLADAAIDFASLKAAPTSKPSWLDDVEGAAGKPPGGDVTGKKPPTRASQGKKTTRKKKTTPAATPPPAAAADPAPPATAPLAPSTPPAVSPPPATPPAGLPSWLGDVEHSEELRTSQTKAAQARAEEIRKNPQPATGLPDWIDDIRKLEQ
jgi:serine/threonine-protein kinase